MVVAAAYPYIRVSIDTRGLQPPATRAVGNVGIVGSADGHGTAQPNIPIFIASEAEARQKLATTNAAGAVTGAGRLYNAVKAALLQDPAPSRVYAVPAATAGGSPDYASALAALARVEVQFVTLAMETDLGVAGPPPTNLLALKDHIESVSADGKRRVGVAMVDPDLTVAAGSTFADDAEAAYSALKSDTSRMILVAARVPVDGAGVPTVDVASATAGAIAGYQPHMSVLLKPIRQVQIPLASQFSASEIKQITEKNMIPLIDPELIPGEGLYFGSGRTYTTDTSRLYVDIVRVLDDIEFRLKAGLISMIGDARIDRLGMRTLAGQIDSILSPLKRRRVIADYTIYIPVLPVLEKEAAARSADESTMVTTARVSRTVEVVLTVTYGPAVHVLDVRLALKA